MERWLGVNTKYECTLEKQLLSKAISELNEPETNEERSQKINQLRNAFIEQNKNLNLIRKDDIFILQFLRAKKFDHRQALNMLTNYHIQVRSWSEVSKKVENPALVKHVFDAGSFVALRRKAYDGSTICIGRPGKARTQILTDYYAAVIISTNRLLDEEDVQINGITVIQDLSYINYNVAKQFPSIARRVFALFENVLPIRLKSMNVVNQSIFVDILLAVVLLIAKQKFRKRISLLRKNYAHLQKLIDPSILPLVYGGAGEDVDGIAAAWWKSVVFEEENVSI